MKRIGLLLVAIICSVSFAADKVVSNKELGFEITFPVEWEANLNPKGTLGASPLAADQSRIIVNVVYNEQEIPEGLSLKKIVEKELDHVLKNVKNGELVEKVETKLGTINAFKVSMLNDMPDGMRIKSVHYYVMANKHLYIVGAMTFKDDYEKYAKVADTALKSFKFIKKESKP